MKYGAAPEQVSTTSEGKRVPGPAVDNRTKEGRFMNRRVTLTVTDQNGKVVGAGGGRRGARPDAGVSATHVLR